MSDQQVIKSIFPHSCPHCKKDFFIVSSVHQPTVDNIITPEEVADAKKKFKERMSEIEFKNKEERKLAEEWVDNPNTIFGLGDLEPLLKTMAISQLTDKQNESPDGNKDS